MTAATRVEVAPRLDRSTWLVLGALWVLATGVLQLTRASGAPPWDTLWQEDGGIFLTDALRDPLRATLVRPYNGYLHLVPRVLAAAAVHLPLADAALLFAVTSAVLVSLLSLWVLAASRALIPALWPRVLLALLVCLAPATAYETTANINNLHWYLLAGLAFAPFAARTRTATAVGLLVTVAAALSDPLALLLAPLLAVPVWRARRNGWPALRRALLAPVVLAACLAIQLLFGVRRESAGRYGATVWRDVPEILGRRFASSLLIGDRPVLPLYSRFGSGFSWTCLALVVGLVLGALVVAPAARPVLLTGSGLALLFAVLTLGLRGTPDFEPPSRATLNGSRYVLLPVLGLATGLLAAAGRLAPRLLAGGGRVRAVPAAVIALVLTVVAANLGTFNVRQPGPSWGVALTDARARCTATRGNPRDGGTSARGNVSTTPARRGDVTAPIAPALPVPLDQAAFGVVISCRELLRRTGPG